MRNDVPNDSPNQVGAARRQQPSSPDAAASAASVSLSAPLHWWRSLPPAAFTQSHLEALNAILSCFAILHEPRWRAAVAGDAPAAIGIALRVTKNRDVLTAATDIVMTALLRPALSGNPGAVLVLATIVRRLVGGIAGQHLASSWLARGGLFSQQCCQLTTLTLNTFPKED